MKALLIGGTGTISAAVSALAVERGVELYVLNRGSAPDRLPKGTISLTGDITDEAGVAALLRGYHFDVVANFIVRRPEEIEREFRLFHEKTDHYIFISTEAVYHRPSSHYMIREEVPVPNPSHAYAVNKAACEAVLLSKYSEKGFPVTVVRPTHTYDDRNFPLDIVPGKTSTWTVFDRIRRGLPVLVSGDGTSLWSLTHADDFARAFLSLMGNAGTIGECVHIATDEALTWNGIYDRIGIAMGCPVRKVHVASNFLAACWPELEGPLVLDKASGVLFDTMKLKRFVPGFTASVRVDQGIRRCLAYMAAHPEEQVIDDSLNRFYDRVIESQKRALSWYQAPTGAESASRGVGVS